MKSYDIYIYIIRNEDREEINECLLWITLSCYESKEEAFHLQFAVRMGEIRNEEFEFFF